MRKLTFYQIEITLRSYTNYKFSNYILTTNILEIWALKNRICLSIAFTACAFAPHFSCAADNLTSSGLYSVIASPSHPVYTFLERLEVRGFIVFRANPSPLTRGEIYECLGEVKAKHDENPSQYRLSRREKLELSRFSEEFTAGSDRHIGAKRSNISGFREKIWPRSPLYRDGVNLYYLNIKGYEAEINPILQWDVLTDSIGDVITIRTNGFNLKAGTPGGVGIYFDFRDHKETGRGPYYGGERWKLYSDHADYVTMKGEDFAYYDLTRAVISLKLGGLRLNMGRGDHKWGSGRLGSLALSTNTPPFDFVSARIDIAGLLRFSYLTGFLYPYPEVFQTADTTTGGHIRRLTERKMIAAHRLEVYPVKGVEIGFGESVIYGERGLELAYLNPINLYFSAEHNLGDMDNVSWFADFELNLLGGISLYGELFIDDMKTGELGTDYIGNKFAYLGGLFLVNPAGLEDTDLTLEYARLDPFVYSHIYPINTYKNWNASLGHFLPPNSDGIFTAFRWKPLYALEAKLGYSLVRHGADTENEVVGGSIDTPPPVDGPLYIPFLSGERMEVSIWELSARWEPLENYSLAGSFRLHKWSGGDQKEWRIIFGLNCF